MDITSLMQYNSLTLYVRCLRVEIAIFLLELHRIFLKLLSTRIGPRTAKKTTTNIYSTTKVSDAAELTYCMDDIAKSSLS